MRHRPGSTIAYLDREERVLRFRFDSVSISSLLLTICLLTLAPPILKIAATWRQRNFRVTDRYWEYNMESLLAFASLALLIIALIVIWTSYQKRMRSAWYIILVFVLVYFLPVNFLDIFLTIRSVGWRWWPQFVRAIMQGQSLAILGLRYFVILILMIVALVIPVRAFFFPKPGLAPGDQSKV